MKLIVDKNSGGITVTAQELSYFSRSRNSVPSGKLDFAEVYNNSRRPDSADCRLAVGVNSGKLDFTVAGKIDYSYDGEVIEKVCQMSKITSRTNPFTNTRFLAESVLCACMYVKKHGLDSIKLVLTYTNENYSRSKSYSAVLGRSFLSHVWSIIIDRALPFIDIEAQRMLAGRLALAEMAFPYSEIRAGQRDFINDTYHAAKTGTRLLVSAPTGIGKTISALYPALRALGGGYTDKVFYLTAKTVTGNAAADACRKMAQQAKNLRAVFVVAKERLCPMRKSGETGACSYTCPLQKELDRVPYEERRDGALLKLLRSGCVIDSAAIENTAAQFKICPYELSLDVSEYCEVVICDYNYVFDPKVRFKRYFSDVNERYMFLIDEAHNLPDRAREIYSAAVSSKRFMQLYKMCEEGGAEKQTVREALSAVLRELRSIGELCRAEERLVDGKKCGFMLSSQPPEKLCEVLAVFCRAALIYLRTHSEELSAFEAALEEAKSFCFANSYFSSKFAFYAESRDGSLRASIRCLDPSELLDSMLCSAKCSVLFSATLTPMDYFADILGCRDAVQLELDSPYDPGRLCIIGVDSVSTRYADRDDYVGEIAEIIMAVAEARQGNYIAYFPSYEYMVKVYKAFAENAGSIGSIVQQPGMGYKERNSFLSRFTPEGKGTLVGFCVLGGAFSEGVDLKGDSLIGTIIVGTGLPKITAEQNILQNYFENTRENGYDYAYTYPSMIKVRQAAGRVIRSEKDKGVVVLVDDRYSDPSVVRLMPKQWRSSIRYTGDPYSLCTAIERFWAM